MESSVRGFSFMPENKVEVMDLQYIEGSELERAWKTSRREKVKQQEMKIWTEFVKEQDIVHSVCEEDPYQFLENVPESTLKELLEKEIAKKQKENEEEIIQRETREVSTIDTDDSKQQQIVSFAEDTEIDCDVFHIFEEDEISGAEEELMNDSVSPSTVRGNNDQSQPDSPNGSPKKCVEDADSKTDVNFALTKQESLTKSDSGKSDNIANIIQSSIHCAKVKEIRTKIKEELEAMITSLCNQDLAIFDPSVLTKICKRSNEFCVRFNRIYMYQLQRQIQDVKRNNAVSLPFAQHTHFQSQMVRINSLNQNFLQAFQVFHKSFEQTLCVRESLSTLRTLLRLFREASDICRQSPAPKDFIAADCLYDDEVLKSCEQTDAALGDYEMKTNSILNRSENVLTHGSRTASEKYMAKKRPIANVFKSDAKSITDGRLSMYSIDKMRSNLNPRPTCSKDNSCGTSKAGLGKTTEQTAATPGKSKDSKQTNVSKKSPKSPKSPKKRNLVKRNRVHEDHLQTMVQTIEMCESTHISREPSPNTKSKKHVASKKEVSPKTVPAKRRDTIKNRTNQNNTKVSPHLKVDQINSQDQTPTRPKQLLKSLTSNEEESNVVDQKLITDEDIQELSNDNAQEATLCDKDGESAVDTPRPAPTNTPRNRREKAPEAPSADYDVTRLLRTLCGGDAAGSRHERVSGTRNAQLVCISGGSPRQPSTPQLLRILEETIEKKAPKSYPSKAVAGDQDKYRMSFNVAQETTDNIYQYRTKFVQHMLTSPLYANSVIGKPWEMIGNVSEQLINEILLSCVKEMEIEDVITMLYKYETR